MRKFLFIIAMIFCVNAWSFTIDPGYSTDYMIIMTISNDSVFQIMEADSTTISEENGGYYVRNWRMFRPVDGKHYVIKESALVDLYNREKIIKENNKNRKKGLPIKQIYVYKDWIYYGKDFNKSKEILGNDL